MKIDFVRHGQTQLNIAGIANSQIMIDFLTDEGIRQAEETATNLTKKYTLIFSSDITRAKQTAEIIGKKLNLPVIFDARLRERDLGSLGGKSWDEIGQDLKILDKKQKYDYSPLGGEDVEKVKERLLNFMDEMSLKNTDEEILVVTHGGIIRLLHHMINNENPITIKNASVHTFEF